MKGGLRRRLTITVTAISALTLLVLVVGFNLALRSSLSADADRLLEARAQAALEGLDVKEGSVTVPEISDAGAPDAQVWIYSGDRNIERPVVSERTNALADALASNGAGTVEDDDSDVRLYALPIQSGSEAVGTVVAGVSLEPYERTANEALIASIVLAVFVLALIMVVTRTVVNRALRPVVLMTADADDWSEHDLDRRFNPHEPNDELTGLAATFDRMLDRMAAMVRHERNFSAEVSHELRTPLASISAEAEVALLRERTAAEYRRSLQRISTRSHELSEILETLLSVARAGSNAAAGDSCDLEEALTAAVRSAGDDSDGSGIAVESAPGSRPILVQGTLGTVQRVLAPVLTNAVTYALSTVSAVAHDGAHPYVTVADDGPGVEAGEREAMFEPGRRGAAERNPGAPEGAGLGLALSRRLARAVGGDVEFTEPTSGIGAEMRIRLLAAPGSEAPEPLRPGDRRGD